MKATRTAMTMRMTNSAGIIIFAAFSIPFSTPLETMKWVMRMKITPYMSGLHEPWNDANCSLNERSELNIEPVMEFTKYSSDQPAIR